MKINLLYILLLVLCSCENEKVNTDVDYYNVPDHPRVENSSESSIVMNQLWIKNELFYIEKYCQRHQLPVIKTDTEISYFVYHNGNGTYAKPGNLVTIDYEVRLLDADTTLCYTSKESGPIQFVVEMDNIESGIHEAITYMSSGDKAFVILPHFLAHGLIGNMDKVPPLSPLLYNITLLDVQEN